MSQPRPPLDLENPPKLDALAVQDLNVVAMDGLRDTLIINVANLEMLATELAKTQTELAETKTELAKSRAETAERNKQAEDLGYSLEKEKNAYEGSVAKLHRWREVLLPHIMWGREYHAAKIDDFTEVFEIMAGLDEELDWHSNCLQVTSLVRESTDYERHDVVFCTLYCWRTMVDSPSCIPDLGVHACDVLDVITTLDKAEISHEFILALIEHGVISQAHRKLPIGPSHSYVYAWLRLVDVLATFHRHRSSKLVQLATLVGDLDMQSERLEPLVDALFVYVSAKVNGKPSRKLGTILVEKAREDGLLLDFGDVQVIMDSSMSMSLRATRYDGSDVKQHGFWDLLKTDLGWTLIIQHIDAYETPKPWEAAIDAVDDDSLQAQVKRMFGDSALTRQPAPYWRGSGAFHP